MAKQKEKDPQKKLPDKAVNNKKKNKTISDAYERNNELTFQCWNKYHSFRLLASILRTQSYGTVYESMMRAKDFVGCKRSRPSRDEQEVISGISANILKALADRKISVRRWCKAHSIDPADLWYSINPEDGSDSHAVTLLKEDFPELFAFDKSEYKDYLTVTNGSDRKQKYDFGKKCHVFWSNYFGIRVEKKQESEALRLYNWRVNLELIRRRLNLLLTKDIDSALTYPPTEFLPAEGAKGKSNNRVLKKTVEESKYEKDLEELLRRDDAVSTLIRDLAKIPTRYRTSTDEAKMVAIRKQLSEDYGLTLDQIRNEVVRERRRIN